MCQVPPGARAHSTRPRTHLLPVLAVGAGPAAEADKEVGAAVAGDAILCAHVSALHADQARREVTRTEGEEAATQAAAIAAGVLLHTGAQHVVCRAVHARRAADARATHVAVVKAAHERVLPHARRRPDRRHHCRHLERRPEVVRREGSAFVTEREFKSARANRRRHRGSGEGALRSNGEQGQREEGCRSRA